MGSVARVGSIVIIALGFMTACSRRRDNATRSSSSGATNGATSAGSSPSTRAGPTLLERRKGFSTKLTKQERDGTPPAAPPSKLFRLVRYRSPAGELAAYVTPPPKEKGRRPAVLWIVGGMDNGIGESAWMPAGAENDQSARAFRDAGFVLMQPSFRGGNDNPGVRESFYGEVDDVLAAAEHLSKLEYVDPKRMYLGGHSTGGTLAVLVAAATDRFRAVFAFGPVSSVVGYGQDSLVFDVNDAKESELRSPLSMLDAIVTPTFVIEGTQAPSNADGLGAFETRRGRTPVHLFLVEGTDHFSILTPATRLLAAKVQEDRGTGITLTAAELNAAVSALGATAK